MWGGRAVQSPTSSLRLIAVLQPALDRALLGDLGFIE
jgi:hypothetical protein